MANKQHKKTQENKRKKKHLIDHLGQTSTIVDLNKVHRSQILFASLL